MDPIGSIKTYKDSTFAMLLAAQARGWEVRYMELADLFVDDGTARARHRGLRVNDRDHDWYAFDDDKEGPLGELDVVLMRQDPPFDMGYITATHILERIHPKTLVVNDPFHVRMLNTTAYVVEETQSLFNGKRFAVTVVNDRKAAN